MSCGLNFSLATLVREQFTIPDHPTLDPSSYRVLAAAISLDQDPFKRVLISNNFKSYDSLTFRDHTQANQRPPRQHMSYDE